MIDPKDYQSADVPVLSDATTTEQALTFMKEKNLELLPIIHEGNKRFYGIVRKKDLLALDETEKKLHLKDLPESFFCPFSLSPSQHLYEALTMMYNYNLPFLPIIDEQKKIIGFLEKGKMFPLMIRLTKAHIPGST